MAGLFDDPNDTPTQGGLLANDPHQLLALAAMMGGAGMLAHDQPGVTSGQALGAGLGQGIQTYMSGLNGMSQQQLRAMQMQKYASDIRTANLANDRSSYKNSVAGIVPSSPGPQLPAGMGGAPAGMPGAPPSQYPATARFAQANNLPQMPGSQGAPQGADPATNPYFNLIPGLDPHKAVQIWANDEGAYKAMVEAYSKPIPLNRPGASSVSPFTGQPIAQNPIMRDQVDSEGNRFQAPYYPPVNAAPPQGQPQRPPMSQPSAPMGAPNVPPGAVQTAISPVKQSYLGGEGNHLSDYESGVNAASTTANRNSFQLDQMANESTAWQMGKFADAKGTAKAYLSSFAQQFGIDTPDWDKQVGDWQAFSKNSQELVRQAVKETSSRAAVQEYQMIQKSLPSAEISKGGFNQIKDQLQSVNDFAQARAEALQNWKSRQGGDGTPKGFEADWNKNVTPGAFLLDRVYNRSPSDAEAMIKNMSMSPEGRATLANIAKGRQYIQSMGKR